MPCVNDQAESAAVAVPAVTLTTKLQLLLPAVRGNVLAPAVVGVPEPVKVTL